MLQQVVELTLTLREPYRSVVLIRYMEDLQPREIAQRLGMPVNTVLSNLQRGLKKLREALEREHGAEQAWCGALMVLVLSPAELRALGLAKSFTLVGGAAPLAVLLALCSLAVVLCAREAWPPASEGLLALVPDQRVELPDGDVLEPLLPHQGRAESVITSLPHEPAAERSLRIVPVERGFEAHAGPGSPVDRLDPRTASLPVAIGAVRTGDVVITSSGSSHEFVLHAADDGAHRAMTTAGTGCYWVGNAILPGGGWACAAVSGAEIRVSEVCLFETGTGREIDSFAIPEVGFPGDIVAFADGTLAVSDRCGPIVQLYTREGDHVGTIRFPGEVTWGIHVDPNDELWVADPLGERVHRFDRAGNRLSSTPVDHLMGDLTSSGDGTFWTTNYFTGVVEHFRLDGAVLESFDSGFTGQTAGVALSSDGTLWVSSISSREVRRFSADGIRLGEILCPARFQPEFLSVAGISPAGTAYCFGDGTGAACPCGNTGSSGGGCANSASVDGALLEALGSASIRSTSLFLAVQGLVPGQPGVYFQGSDAIDGGHGSPFGDGLRCAGGEITRIEIATADEGGISHTTVDVAAEGGVSAGQTRRYQLWYRDPAGSPCGRGFNLTNGIEIEWRP